MDKILFFQDLYSNKREELIAKCIELQQKGKSFLYILPSREAIREVRYAILDENKGMLNSKVIMFDELERDIASEFIDMSRIIYEDFEKTLIEDICESEALKLVYFNKISSKRGFQEEVRAFIKYFKRSRIEAEGLKIVINKVEDEILKEKLEDLSRLYKAYVDRLENSGLYDINDISLIAAEKIEDSSLLKSVDTIIIDGFVNIDKVNIELIKNLAAADKLNIYINCPYKNAMVIEFISKEIKYNFQSLGFDICEEEPRKVPVKEVLMQTAERFYSGEKLEAKPDNIFIDRYPCIEAEVRETARQIKKLLLQGQEPEGIAVFANDLEAYKKQLFKGFGEFKIPVSLKNETSLDESDAVRRALKKLEALEGKITAEAAIEEYNRYLLEEARNVEELVRNAFNKNLLVEDKVLIKSLENSRRLTSNLKRNLKLAGLLGKEVNKEDFLQLIREYIQGTEITLDRAETSGVKILNTDLAKGVYYSHVFILGLNEGEIPKIIRNEGLFDELEAAMLHSIGIGYKDQAWELEREKIRFNLAIAAAKESLTLSYRTSTEEGKFAIQSSFLEQLRFLTGLQNRKKLTMWDRFNLDLNSVMSSDEMKAVVLKQYFENKYKGFQDFVKRESINFLKAYEKNIEELIALGQIEYHRNNEAEFNRYEGIIGDGFENLQYNTGGLSASKIDSYQNCPFKYMLKNIFGVEEPEEDKKEYKNKDIGILYHGVLKGYYDNIMRIDNGEQQKLLEALKKIDETKFDEIFEEEVKKLRKSSEAREEDSETESIKENLHNFIAADLKRMKKYHEKAQKVIKPYVNKLIQEDAEPFGVPLSCKIDRIDLEYEIIKGVLKPTGRYIVYIYKKNDRPESSALIGLEHSELVLCHFLAEKYLKAALKDVKLDCMALLYLSVEQTGSSVNKTGYYRTEYKKALGFTENSKLDMNKEWFYAYMNFMKEVIKEILNNISKGKYPYRLCCERYEDEYKHCSYKAICRYSRNKMEVMGLE